MYNLLAVEPQKGGINMATRQYIGARYVPKFDGDWDITKEYEPLVIVSYQGNSYTSKTYVPANTDINDDFYWGLTGNYNAQVEAYRQAVASLNETLSKLNIKGEDLIGRTSIEGITYGRGNTASSLSITNDDNEAFINGDTLSEFVGYKKIDSVVLDAHTKIGLNTPSTGFIHQITSVDSDSITVAGTLYSALDVGIAVVLFNGDPRLISSLDGAYIGIVTNIVDNNTLEVSAWYACGDTSLTPVIPTNVSYAVVGCHTATYVHTNDMYIEENTPNYHTGFSGGESNLWDYKGVTSTLKDIIVRAAKDTTNVIGVSVRNQVASLLYTIGTAFNARNMTTAFRSQNCANPFIIENGTSIVIPFDSVGIPNTPYIKTGRTILLTNGDELNVTATEYDSYIHIFNNSDNACLINFDTYLNFYGKLVRQLSLKARESFDMYFAKSSGTYYFTGGTFGKNVAMIGTYASVAPLSASATLESLNFVDGECKTVVNMSGTAITLTGDIFNCSDGSRVENIQLSPRNIATVFVSENKYFVKV